MSIGIIVKDRNRLVRMQKDIINQVCKSGKQGTDNVMKQRIRDFKQVSKEGGLKTEDFSGT